MAIVERSFPELINVFGEDELLKLGGSLRIRYNNENIPTTTWLTNNRNKLEMFKDYLYLKNEFYTENIGKIVERANEEGLIVMPISSDMAILYYDLSNRVDSDLYKSHLLGQKNIDDIYKKYAHLADEKSQLVSLGLLSFSDKNDPVEGIDFVKPNQNLNLEKTKNVIKFALDIGFQFIPIQYVSTIYSVASSTAQFIINRSGKNQILKKSIYSHAQLSALFEAGVMKNIDFENVVIESLIEQLKDLNIDDDIIATFEMRFEHAKSNDDVSKVVSDIYLLFADYLSEKRKFSKLDTGYKLANKIVGWSKLSAFMQKPILMRSLHDWLKKREDENLIQSRYSQRKPSSDKINGSKPLIMFIVGGVSSQIIHQANREGLIPNINKYILKTAVEFDTYATQPLSLPTIASIFTGLPVDEHGLRSNSPISRFDEKPKHNYNDPRPEMVVPKYSDKSRSYRHLEEAGARLFFDDLFVANERYFNSLPIYNEGSLPIDKYIKNAIKVVPKFFNDLFKNALVVDMASGEKAAENIRTAPGKYGLIVNWYRCAATFLKTSNKALYQCLKEIDHAIGTILEVSQNDKELKNADIYFISDSGFMGATMNSYNQKNNTKEFLNNTGFNLTKFFTGDFNSHSHMVFPVATYESPKPDYDLKFIHDYYLNSFSYIYRGKNKNRKGDPTIMVDYQGDAQARLYLKHKVEGWNKKNSFYELTHFITDNNVGYPINLVDELLNFELKNTEIINPTLKKYIKDKTSNRPVKWISYLIESKLERESIATQLELAADTELSVILSKDHGQAFIFTKKDENNKLLIKIVPIKNFTVSKLGEVKFEKIHQDLFGLSHFDNTILNRWTEERECLNKLKNFTYSVLCSHFGRVYKLSGKLHEIEQRVGEIADLIVYSNEGFNFNSSFLSEADTGFIENDSSKISFFHTTFTRSTIDSDIQNYFKQTYPIFERDITPFILLMSNPEARSANWNPEWDGQVKLYEDYKTHFSN